MSLFAFGVSRKRLEQSVRELGLPVTVARELDEADAVVTLRNYYRRKPAALRDAESSGVPIYVLKTNTVLQMDNMLASLYDLEADPQEAALRKRRRPSASSRHPASQWSCRRRTRTCEGSSTRWPSGTAS